MKLTCTQENLSRGLQIVARLSDKSVNLPILNNILLRAEKDGLLMATTNLEMGIKTKIRGKIEEEGEFTVNAKLLAEFVSTLKRENIAIVLEDKNLQIQGENHQTVIRGLDASEFPIIPDVESSIEFTVKAGLLREALSQTIFAVSTDESRPELCGVLMVVDGTTCSFAATDSYRLTEKTIKIEGSADSTTHVILPSKTLQELARILDISGVEAATVRVNDSQVLFLVGETEIVSRIISGNYPDYKQIIPNQFTYTTEFDVADMVRAVKTSSLFCKQGINDIRLSLVNGSGEIAVQAENSSAGKNISTVATASKDQELDIVFNYRFLLDGLQHIATPSAILKTNDNVSTAMLASPNDDGFTYIIMPIRQ